MTDSTPWLTQLRALIDRQANDDAPAEQLSLSAMDLLDTVPDYEICEAYQTTEGGAGGALADLLAAECERRNLDY